MVITKAITLNGIMIVNAKQDLIVDVGFGGMKMNKKQTGGIAGIVGTIIFLICTLTHGGNIP